MSLSLAPYPVYKDLGVGWLGKVPEHWPVPPSRALLTEAKKRDCPDEPMLSVTITRGVIPQTSLLNDTSKKDSSNEDKSAYKLVRPGDIVYNKMRAWQGAVGVSDVRGIVSPAYVVLRLRGNGVPRYYHYLLRTVAFAKEAERWSYGIASDMWSLRPEHFKLIRLCAPPAEEQAAIVRFLDHADGRVHHYVRAKQELIELLEEQKQVIIHRAVTGQVDVRTGKPYQAYRDSGVKWFGQVPTHWDVRRLGALGRLFKGIGGTKEDDALDGVPCVRYGDIYMHYQYVVRESRSFLPVDRVVDYTQIRHGDVLFAGSGETFDEIGKSVVCMIDSPAYCGGDVVVFRPCVELDSAFMGYATNSEYAIAQKSRMGRGFTVVHVYADQLKNLWLALPPRCEQTAIGRYLDSAVAKVNRAMQHAKREIDLAREYRARLISDVVTGKLDVREAAANLPDDVEEPEELAEDELLAGESEPIPVEDDEVALEEVET